jgi:[histone H3]-lysine36 N-dimethyltransferase SETMAR
LALAGLAVGEWASPPPHSAMSPIRDFVAGLARAGKGCKEIEKTIAAAYKDVTLKKTQIYEIIKLVKKGKSTEDKRKFNGRRKVRDPAFIADVATAVKENRRVTVRKLASTFGVTKNTIHRTLRKDLNLSKKSARWVPKLLTDEMKMERVRTSEALLAMVRRRSLAVLDNVVTMDESAVSFHTPETKRQSMQWLPKGQPGPIKAKVHATRTKQMVLCFFDSKGLIYTNYVPRGTTVNANYILDALGRFMKIFKQKRPITAQQDWFLHWDNAPVHSAAVVQDWLAARGVQVLQHPPYSPDLAPADFFLFPKLKNHLAGKTITAQSFKKEWEGAVRTLSAADFADAFQQWHRRCEKCVAIGGSYVEKT